MSSIVIPTLSDPFYSLRITLDGVDYNFDFNYSTREKRWYFDIYDVENNLLLAGTKVVCLYPLNAYQQEYYNLPPGTLICASGTDDNSPPTVDELGLNKRCLLIYYPVNQSTTSV